MVVLLSLYCVVEVAQAESGRVRNAPKWLWAAAVICLPVVGPLAWLFAGRPSNGTPRPPRRRPIGPDDDPDFLRNLRKR